MNVSYNWGRWVTSCPSDGCLGALEVRIGQTSVVCDCGDTQICDHAQPILVNLDGDRQALICGTTTPLAWPERPERIVEICARRPVPNRNWHPAETVDDLKRENLTHGVGLPKLGGR